MAEACLYYIDHWSVNGFSCCIPGDDQTRGISDARADYMTLTLRWKRVMEEDILQVRLIRSAECVRSQFTRTVDLS